MEKKNKGQFEMDLDTKQYLDDFKKDIKETLKNIENHIKELIESTIKPIEKQLNQHTKDISDLYDKDRETRDRVGRVEGRVTTLEKGNNNRKFSTEMIIVVFIAIGSIITSIVLGLIK